MRDVLVGEAAVEQQVLRAIAGNAEAAFADEFHGPVLVVAAAVHHAVQVGEQHLEKAGLVLNGLACGGRGGNRGGGAGRWRWCDAFLCEWFRAGCLGILELATRGGVRV
jgi:hypothetical protein